MQWKYPRYGQGSLVVLRYLEAHGQVSFFLKLFSTPPVTSPSVVFSRLYHVPAGRFLFAFRFECLMWTIYMGDEEGFTLSE